MKEAAALAFANYCDEQKVVKELPQVCDVPGLNGFAENGLGVAAFEDDIHAERRRLYQAWREL